MPVTISVASGDGINNAALRMNIGLPDTGNQVTIQGIYQPAALAQAPPNNQQAVLAFAGTVTSPGFNATWTTFWGAEINPSTGSYKAISGTSTMPTADSGNLVLFSQAMGTAASSTVSMTIQPAITFPSLVNVAPY